MSVHKSKSGTAYLLTDAQAIVDFKSVVSGLGDIGQIKKEKTDVGEALIKWWGGKNNAPSLREELLRSNAVEPALVNTKRNMTVGLDFFCFEERFQRNTQGKNERVIDEIEMPSEVLEFFEASEGSLYHLNAANELFTQANIFTEFIPDAGTAAGTTRQRFPMMKLQQSRYIRAEQMTTEGVIENYYWRGDGWVKRSDEKRAFVPRRISAYNPMLPIEQQDLQGFLYHTGDTLFTDEYYYIPSWEGAYKWIRLAQIIAEFHEANLKHGYTVRYHVEINSELLDQGADEPSMDPEAEANRAARREAAKAEILQKVNDLLAGHDKAGRAVITEFRVEISTGKEVHDVLIKPINVDLKDEALLRLWEKATQASMSAFQVHPTLANIETQGRLSSGTEMRNSYLMWLAIHASTYRDILLRPWYLAKRLNGWNPKLKFGFRDAVLTTLADNATGQKTEKPTA